MRRHNKTVICINFFSGRTFGHLQSVMNEIVRNIRNGHIETFQLVYRQYHTKLYFYVLKHTKSAYLAEETVQLTFIKLWEKRGGLSEDIGLSPQLFRIAKSMMFDLLRKESSTRDAIAAMTRDSGNECLDPEALHKADLQEVYKAIEKMSPVRKKVFKLSRFNGLTQKDIAEHLSISPKTVENHIGRAIRQLKDSIFLLVFLFISSLR